MRISCPSCQSSYKIADDKVQGRTVKVRCRKCGLMIHVNEHGVANDAGGGGAQPAQPSADAGGPSSPQFSVLVSEGDQRDMTLADVVSAYNSGFVTADTFVWAEGQPDWMPLAQIPEIVEALNAASAAVDAQATDEPVGMAAPAPEPAPAPAPAPEPAPPPMDFSAPPVPEAAPPSYEQPVPSPPPGGMFGAAAAPAPAPEPTPLFGASQGAAVREARRAGNVDLFGTQARAGADEEVATSAPVMVPDHGQKPLGARDESSVLFSLSALTATQGSSPSASSADKKDDSGLIDLRALADKDEGVAPSPVAAMPGAILDSAPLLGTPLVDPNLHQLKASEPPPSKSNKGLIIGVAFGLGGMLIAVVVAVFALTREPPAPPPVATAPVDTDTATAPTTTPPPADTGSSAAAAPATGAASTAAAPTKPPSGGGRPRTGPASTKTSGGAATTAPTKPASTGGKPPPKKSPCGCAPTDLACNMSCSVR